VLRRVAAAIGWTAFLASAAPVLNLEAQMPQVGIIDFYGARRVSEADLRRALPVHEGDPMPDSSAPLVRALEQVPGVRKAAAALVCCEAGQTILYVGIEESTTTAPTFHPEPHGTLQLPRDVIVAGEAFYGALEDAARRGDIAEDESEGHALVHDSLAQSYQKQFIVFAGRDLTLLRRVLRESADPEQRALAAQVLAYSSDKSAVVPDLVYAIQDPAENVRNNAVRALAVMAAYAANHPEAGIHISAEPFVEMLNSLVWTDRNKASLALMHLSASADSETIEALRRRGMKPLLDMVRWKSRGHAAAAFVILGRMGGLTHDALATAWNHWDTTTVIRAATTR
jgi:hypothetical protein